MKSGPEAALNHATWELLALSTALTEQQETATRTIARIDDLRRALSRALAEADLQRRADKSTNGRPYKMPCSAAEIYGLLHQFYRGTVPVEMGHQGPDGEDSVDVGGFLTAYQNRENGKWHLDGTSMPKGSGRDELLPDVDELGVYDTAAALFAEIVRQWSTYQMELVVADWSAEADAKAYATATDPFADE